MPVNVIYLDDEPDVCQIFEDNFANKNVSIRTFIDPDEAVAAINSSKPDLVFLDYRLPGTNADEVSKRITVSVPIAIISGDLTLVTSRDYAELFSKPFEFKDVERFILSFLKTS